jgi:hypothetical protein
VESDYVAVRGAEIAARHRAAGLSPAALCAKLRDLHTSRALVVSGSAVLWEIDASIRGASLELARLTPPAP